MSEYERDVLLGIIGAKVIDSTIRERLRVLRQLEQRGLLHWKKSWQLTDAGRSELFESSGVPVAVQGGCQ